MEKLSDDDKYDVLYPIWEEDMFYRDDEEEALKIAKEKYPNVSDDDILDCFLDFLSYYDID